MIIKKIEINNFRNIKEAELEFTEGCNVFYGKNAQGKTNMLEALSVCLGNSFRQAKAASFIPFLEKHEHNKNTRVQLSLLLDNIENKECTVKFDINQNGKVSINLNGIMLNNAYDLYGELKYVVFTPDDLNLLKGGPESRRDYLDNIAILQNKSHIKFMLEYKRALAQKNALNIEIMKNPLLSSTSDSWNDILARQGINLTYGRIRFFDMLKRYATELYSEFAGNAECLDLKYKSVIYGDIFKSEDIDFSSMDSKKKLYNEYINQLNQPTAIGADGKTRAGAHRDDIVFTIDSHNAKEFGSQGQLRGITLALKLAEAETIRNYNNERPVILLDEVLGEFDVNRRKLIIKHFDKSQVFITSCNKHDFETAENLRVWEVKGGCFKML